MSRDIADQLKKKLFVDPFNTVCFNKFDGIDKIELGGGIATTQQIKKIVARFQIDICKTFVGNQCYNQSFLKIANPFTYSLFLNNYFVNMSSKRGYQEFTDFYNLDSISFDSDVSVIMKIKKNTIYTDDNILFNFLPPKLDLYYTYSVVQLLSKERTGPTNLLTVSFDIELDKFQNVYRRSYMKIDQLLANTMSIFSVLLLIFESLTKFIVYGSLEFYLMKKLYYFDSKCEYKSIQMKNLSLLSKFKKRRYLSNFKCKFRFK